MWLAPQVAVYSLYQGEAQEMMAQWRELLGGYALYVVFFTGVASFIISVCTMQATKFATPLTVSVLGILKQVRRGCDERRVRSWICRCRRVRVGSTVSLVFPA